MFDTFNTHIQSLTHLWYIACIQAVEYFVEWALSPTNAVFLRVQTGVYDPLLIGDKAKWFSQGLQKVDFRVYAESGSTLGAALESFMASTHTNDENPTGMFSC